MDFSFEYGFFASWGFRIEGINEQINVTNSLLDIPLIGIITGIALTVFILLKRPYLHDPDRGLLVKATLSALSLGPVLLFADLAIFFIRLHATSTIYERMGEALSNTCSSIVRCSIRLYGRISMLRERPTVPTITDDNRRTNVSLTIDDFSQAIRESYYVAKTSCRTYSIFDDYRMR